MDDCSFCKIYLIAPKTCSFEDYIHALVYCELKIRLAGAVLIFFLVQILVFTGSQGLLIAVTLGVIECLSNNPGNSTALQLRSIHL